MQELLYTSAPKGLKPGSRGFCTVLSSSGMPAPVATALEGLSAYRPVFPPGDPQAKLNPVVSSHILLSLVGQRRHVLSRISDHGLDYSQRTNKLAHHVVLEREDRPAAGPGWFLGSSGLMRSDWDGVPRVVQNERVIPSEEIQPKVCQEWKEMTGDAGWGGVLAEAFLADPNRLVYIILEPGMDLLPLIEESIALLPTEKRWDVTFSTYFTKLPKGAVCQCRCVLAGSSEANESRRHVNALRIDLSQDPGVATGGVYVTAARTGELPLDSKPVAPLAEDKVSDGNNSEAGPPSIKIAQDKSTPPKPIPPSRRRQNRKRKAQKSNVGLWGAFFAVLTLLVAVIAILLLNPPENVPQKETVAKNESQEESGPEGEGEGLEKETGEDDSRNSGTNKKADKETDTAGEGAEAGADDTEGSMGQSAEGAPVAEKKEGESVTAGPSPDKQEAEEKEPTYTKPGIFNWLIDDLAKSDGKLVYDKLRLPPDAPLSLSLWVPNDLVSNYSHSSPEKENDKPYGKTRIQVKDEYGGGWSQYLVCGLTQTSSNENHLRISLNVEKPERNRPIDFIKRFVVEIVNGDTDEKWTVLLVNQSIDDKSTGDQGFFSLGFNALFTEKEYSAKLKIDKCKIAISGKEFDLVSEDRVSELEIRKGDEPRISLESITINQIHKFSDDLRNAKGVSFDEVDKSQFETFVLLKTSSRREVDSKLVFNSNIDRLKKILNEAPALLVSNLNSEANGSSKSSMNLKVLNLSNVESIEKIEHNMRVLSNKLTTISMKDSNEEDMKTQQLIKRLKSLKKGYMNVKVFVQERDALLKRIDEAKLTYVSIKQHGTNGVEPGYFPFVEFGAPMNNDDEREGTK
ncbi:GAP1-N2 domain-containing protein [Thalassoglobus polymorphus]|uniref:Uncharacterized protein n=1 Tax=Thalassoglobus polymorphus TaxID=2527994 RepID=A0A517QUA6_9PLAN|nr:hypothetical protein [Thalassoglobus polymorphus]QDT35173.1 hypothetical protein Mal48_44490 [Thalassoglobus polymorphus]